jgi:hypothetical protein
VHDDELLRRLDAHLARGNQIMARSNEVMARSNQVIQESRGAFGDLRSYLRELTRRHERGFEELLRQSARHSDALEAGQREFVAEMQAQRQALFRILDRLDRNGGAAGA